MDDAEGAVLPRLWTVDPFSKDDGMDYICLTAPNGFIITMKNPSDLVIAIVLLSLRDIEISLGETRAWIEKDGTISVIDTDPWLNPEFSYGSTITTAKNLKWILGNYLMTGRHCQNY